MHRALLSLLLAATFSGCASFDQSELSQAHRQGVSPQVVAKLDRGRPLAPGDVSELTRRGVPDEWIIRQLEDHGVDSIFTRSDIIGLRRGGVRPAVIDAVIKASDRFAGNYGYGNEGYGGMYYDEPGFGFHDPYPSPWYGGFGATFVVPLNHHGHHHRHW